LKSTCHYQKTKENQWNYRRKYSIGSYYRQTKFCLKICQYIPTKIFHRYISTISLTDYFFKWFYLRNDWGIQTEIVVQWHGTVTDEITDKMYPSVIPLVKTIIYTPSADTLFLCFSFFFPIPPLPSQTTANHPSQLSTILNTSTQVSNTLYNIRFLWIVYLFLSKSILFSFNI